MVQLIVGEKGKGKTKVLEKRITRQAGKYDLQRKLLESIKLCEDITTCNLNTGQIQIAFILVTDVNVASNPLNVLTQQLNMLAFTTSSWEKVCNFGIKKANWIHRFGNTELILSVAEISMR